MTTYLLAYRAPADYTPGRDTFHTWARWYQQLGAHLKDRGNPVFAAQTVATEPGATTMLGGYSLLRAASLDAAAHLARGCPILTVGGCVEVGELTNIDDEYDHWVADHPTSEAGCQP